MTATILPIDAATSVPSLRTLGTGALQAAPGLHAAAHRRSGADAVVCPVANPRSIAFETASRIVPWSGQSITSGRRYLMYFSADDDQTLSALELWTGATAGVGVTAARLGLYTVAVNGDVTLAARTALDATIGGVANTQFSRALDTTGGFPASLQLVRAARYAAAFYITATTTTPTVQALSAGLGAFYGTAPRTAGFDGGGGTDLNASQTSANITAFGQNFYLAGS